MFQDRNSPLHYAAHSGLLDCVKVRYHMHILPVNSISDDWNDNLHSLNQEKNKHQYQSLTQIGRQFQSLKCQVYSVWTSVSFPLCQRSCLIWRIMMNTYVVIFLLASFFGPKLSFQIQNFEFTAS